MNLCSACISIPTLSLFTVQEQVIQDKTEYAASNWQIDMHKVCMQSDSGLCGEDWCKGSAIKLLSAVGNGQWTRHLLFHATSVKLL